ncbi:MAG: uracil-DNA glycosylase [Roseitalea sp.]|jgi:DNA polymerase|nr:uracil-DNA glycosylase [Roseitalea sp.]MBO6720557.1 uracil-DNA glycosylase [Roseitalea sp.]MBO6743704.1 uracil-DNA glycosylase [Roseitalea sp.]
MTAIAEPNRAELEQLLRFYADSGLDFALEAEPADRFETATQEPRPAAATPSAPGPTLETRSAPPPVPNTSQTARIPDDQAVALARQAADGAADLDALRTAVETFEGCNLKRSARATIFEGGTRGASVMLVGAAPSRDDDKNGEAFSGIDGIVLGKMLAAIGLDRQTDIYAGFCVPWTVPGGERPTALHMKICAPFLDRQIALARPAVIVALGNAASQQILGSKKTITQLRGTWTETDFGAGPVPVTALFDPAFLREQPRFKRMAWLDLLALKKRLTDEPGAA